MFPFIHIGPYVIPLYGLLLTTGFVTASTLTLIRIRKMQGDVDYAFVVIAVTFLGAILGGYFVYLFVSYGISNVIEDIKAGRLDFLTNPGIVFYGGLIGGTAAALLSLHLFQGISLEMFVKAAVPTVPLGHAIGRIGCLLGGCCYGFPYSGRFSVCLKTVDHRVFPIQIVESLLNIILFVVLMVVSARIKKPINLLAIYFCSYASIRFCLEFFRGDLIRGIYLGLSTSQWISILLFIGPFFILLFSKVKKRNKQNNQEF
jgi:phosphatidylglycerol:prolipoprotein diacylglycerol transferase